MVAHQRDRLAEGFQSMNEGVREAIERPVELVKEYPLSSMLLMFGVGMGVGVLLSQAISGSFIEMFEPEPSTTEKIKRQLYDAVTSVISPSMLRQIQSYTSQ